MTPSTARRLSWGLVGLAIGLAATALALAASSGLGVRQLPVNAAELVAVTVGALVFGGVGALIVGRYPGNLLGWAFCGVAVVFPMQAVGYVYAYIGLIAEPGTLPAADVVEIVGEVLWVASLVLTTVVLFLLFPDGRPTSVAKRRILLLAGGGTILTAVGVAGAQTLYGEFEHVTNPLAIAPTWVPDLFTTVGFAMVLGAIVASVVSVVGRFRRSRGEERQQMKWFVTAAVLVFAIELPVNILEVDSGPVAVLSGLTLLALPVSVGIAILRYRLYEIDIVIRKTIVYAILVGLILALGFVAVYVGRAVLVERVRDNDDLILLAGALLGLLFWPLRRLATGIADRIVFRGRVSPYDVLRSFAGRVGETYSSEEVLSRMARVLGEGMGAARAHVWLRVGAELRLGAGWPDEAEPRTAPLEDGIVPSTLGDHASEVRHRGDLLGALSVSMPTNDPMTPSKERLVEDLASQAGLVLRNVRLIEELRESRRRIVAAQDERARKLERDIHDGAQQQLVALAVKLRLAEQLAVRDSAKTQEMLAQLQHETTDALENLRDLARGIYPPLLADKGLAAALGAQARKSRLPVDVVADGIRRYSQEVEAAVYFCVLEALQNVTKYAKAERARVLLGEADGDLAFRVEDDGVGFDPAEAGGSGLRNMRDRLEALGGEVEIVSARGSGTTVAGHVPARALDVSPP